MTATSKLGVVRVLVPVSGCGGEFDGGDAGEAGEHVGVCAGEGEDAGVGVERDGGGFFFGDGEVFAQGADGGDELLHGGHGGEGEVARGEVGGLGVAGEGDGFCGGCAVVEGVPDLFGEEGHEGREQAQRGLEDGDEGGEGDGGVVVDGDVEEEAELDEFEVPVAELAPEELVDGGGGFVEAVVGEGAVDFGGDGVEAGEDPAGFERGVVGEYGGGRARDDGLSRIEMRAAFGGVTL